MSTEDMVDHSLTTDLQTIDLTLLVHVLEIR